MHTPTDRIEARAQPSFDVAEHDRVDADATNDLIGDRRGAVTLEYVTVLVFVSLVGAGALALVGIPLIQRFRHVQMLINLPFP